MLTPFNLFATVLSYIPTQSKGLVEEKYNYLVVVSPLIYQKSEDLKMKNILTELYYGNVDPQARGFKKDSYLQKQMSILSKCETELTSKLDGEEKTAFLSFANAFNVILGESELDSFIVGFRLGARFIYDTFVDSTAPYEDFLREVNNES